jgi:ribosome-binding factor A
MKPYSRSDRVAGLIKQEMADLLYKEISDPRLAMTTITGVKMSRDLRLAKIYFSVSGGENVRQAAAEGFKQARGYFKRELAQRLELRYMPDLVFYYDESIDYGARIEQLLKKVKNNKTP